MEPVLTALGRWVAGLDYPHIPASTLAAARAQVLDMIATAHAGRRSPVTDPVTTTIERLGCGEGRASVLGAARRAAPHDAALANAACSMAQDFDDVVWMGHTCHSAVFAALAVAEHQGADARAFLTAVVAANEVAGRLGASCIFGPLNGQMWTFIHLVGAASAASSLLGLDANATTHALAISLAQPNFALQPGFLAPSSKILAAGTPTAAGIQAAYFAREGMTGEPSIVEDPRGFWSRFSYLPLRPMMGGLGERWTTETLAIKTYPGCHYFQTACTALERLMDRGAVRAERITAVRIDTTKLATEATRFACEYAGVRGAITPVNASFDLRVTAAILLHAGRLTSAEVEPSWLARHSEAIARLSALVVVRHAPELTLRTVASLVSVGAGRTALASLGPREAISLMRRYRDDYRSELLSWREAADWLRAIHKALRHRDRAATRHRLGPGMPLFFPARVTVELAGGEAHSERVDLPVGSFCSPEMPRALEAKFLREAGATLGRERASAGLAAGLALEQVGLEAFVALVARP